MKIKLIFIILLHFLVSVTACAGSNFSQHINYEKVVKSKGVTLTQYLKFLKRGDSNTVGFSTQVTGWLTLCDVPLLMTLIESSDSVKSAYNMSSSKLVFERSTMREQAIFMILGVKNNSYPPLMMSTDVEKKQKLEVLEWASGMVANIDC